MGSRRFVFLDPDGTGGRAWLYVVVEAPTGVVYRTQYGGTACRQGEVEGYLVPVHAPGALAALRQLFEKGFRGAGTWGHSWSDGELDGLRGMAGGIRFWVCDGRAEEPHGLRLDESRISDADEGWIPVITPDGPGVLMWSNSD